MKNYERDNLALEVVEIKEKLNSHCEQQKIDVSTLYRKLDSKASKEDVGEIKVAIREAVAQKANKWVEKAFWWVITVLAVSNIVAIYLAAKGT